MAGEGGEGRLLSEHGETDMRAPDQSLVAVDQSQVPLADWRPGNWFVSRHALAYVPAPGAHRENHRSQSRTRERRAENRLFILLCL